MSDSLRDQLLNAGFRAPKETSGSKKKRTGRHARKMSGDRGKRRQPAVSAQNTTPDTGQQRARHNDQAAQVEARRLIKASIRKLIEESATREYQGDSVYRFVLNKRIRELHVTDDIRQQLVAGSLVITRLNGATWLVPDECATAIRALNPDWALVTPASDAAVEQSGYEDFPVPDDLQW